MHRAWLMAAALVVTPTWGATKPAIVTSAAPDRVALTIYRAPYGRGPLNLQWLGGFALVTETRRLRLPQGPATIRFEGVAEGIVPVSAVVDGLPGDVIERNRDARLLSPASLVDGSLGRQVMLTRTDRATGRVSSEPAMIVAGPVPGVVLRTPHGIETLRCSGLPEGLSYPDVPPGLSARPVLSVDMVSPRARTVTVRLSYLASGFDWRASYVATLAPDGRSLDLFAWLTLANGNGQAFPNAAVRAVAGRVNHRNSPGIPAQAGALRLSCYPLGTTTSGLKEHRFEPADEIMVTGSRLFVRAPFMAAPAPPPPPPPPPPPLPPEDLGDLKLYRVPAPATVSARAQKQVALLHQAPVPFERRYRRRIELGSVFKAAGTDIVLVLRNDPEAHLGIALPAGDTALYAPRGGGRLLLGLGDTADHAAGEVVRLAAGVSRQVLVSQANPQIGEAVLTVRNANAVPVTVELPIGAPGQKIDLHGGRIERVDGTETWMPTVPAQGQLELRYRFDPQERR